MDENIFAILALDKSKSFCGVKPLYGPCFFQDDSLCDLTPAVSIEGGTADGIRDSKADPTEFKGRTRTITLFSLTPHKHPPAAPARRTGVRCAPDARNRSACRRHRPHAGLTHVSTAARRARGSRDRGPTAAASATDGRVWRFGRGQNPARSCGAPCGRCRPHAGLVYPRPSLARNLSPDAIAPVGARSSPGAMTLARLPTPFCTVHHLPRREDP